MRQRFLTIALIFISLLGGSFLLGMILYLFSTGGNIKIIGMKNEVGLVTIEGGIFESTDTVKEIEKYREDDDIKAIIVRIDSPGGTVAASQEIYSALKRASKIKPVVASMGSIAASGGYYIALGATKSFANPGTITGSIGVRMEHVEIGELLRWAKINHETLKSGRMKDIASSDRPLTDEERTILNDMLKEIHSQFKKTVAESRKLDPDEVEKIADGRIYSGQKAKELHLVDELGGFEDALDAAGKLAGIKGKPEVVEKYKRRNWLFETVFESAFGKIKSAAVETTRTTPMLFYWY